MPDRPQITAAADDETGTSATLTVVAGDPADEISFEYRLADGGWSTFGTTLTGSGTKQITGLTAGVNEFLGIAEQGGSVSKPSTPIRCIVSDGSGGEPRQILAAVCAELSESISGIAIWYPWATFNPEAYDERIQVFPSTLGPSGGRAGERRSQFGIDAYAVVKKVTNLGRAWEIAEMVRATLEEQDFHISTGKILRLKKPSLEGQVLDREEQQVLVRVAGRYQSS